MGIKSALFAVFVAVAFYCLVYKADQFEPQTIRGKRVLITGSSSGIGEQLAYAYSRLGATILLTARRTNLLETVAAKCKELGAQRVEYVAADMARAEDREKVVAEVEKRLGGLDHLILNHAIFAANPFIGGPQNMTSLQRDLQVNFVSFVHLATMSVRLLSKSKDGIGRIGVVSSGAGKMGAPFMASYSADKFALQGFFGAWRQELRGAGTPVTVTICVLGYIHTDTSDKIMTERFPKVVAMLPTEPPSAADTAEVIMKSVASGKYEIYYPWLFMRVGLIVQSLIPGYFEDYMGSTMTDLQ